MILLIKRRNAVLILLILFLSIAVFSMDGSSDPIALAANRQYKSTEILAPGHGGDDYRVIMTRQEDVLNYKPGTKNITEKRRQDLTGRRKLIDSSGADIVVSIHLNKFEDPQYYGAQAFYPPGSAESERLAVCVQNALRENVDPSNNRKALVQTKRIVILRDLVVPTTLVECGFLSNSQEEALLRTVDYQEKIAKALKKGIDDYFSE